MFWNTSPSSVLKSLSITWHRAIVTKHCVPGPGLSISPTSPPSVLTTSPEDRTTSAPIDEQIEHVIPGPQHFLQRCQWMTSSEQHQTTRESNWFWGSSLVKTIEKTGFRPFKEWKILKARTITAKDSAKTSHPAQKLKLRTRVQYSFSHYVLNHLHKGLTCRVHCELPGRPIIIFR